MKKRHCSHKISVTSNATQLTDISLQDHVEADDDNNEEIPKQRPNFSRSISANRSLKRQKSLTMQTLKEESSHRSDQELGDNTITDSQESTVSREMVKQ